MCYAVQYVLKITMPHSDGSAALSITAILGKSASKPVEYIKKMTRFLRLMILRLKNPKTEEKCPAHLPPKQRLLPQRLKVI